MSKPFRWSIEKREQLGGLLASVPKPRLRRGWFLQELRETAAKVLAMSGAADLAWIGRTPENFYDYLSGAFSGIGDAPRQHLVQFSMRWAGEGGVRGIDPEKLEGLFDYLRSDNLNSEAIAKRGRSLALVDFVAYGGTMKNFVQLLHLQCEREWDDWPAVQRRLQIIGLRVKTKNSPNTWRWQQNQHWLSLIPDAVIKNVSASSSFLFHIANDQPKVTRSYHAGRWSGDEQSAPGGISEDQLKGLAFAAELYDIGKSREERLALAAEIARQPQMKNPAIRALALKLKRG